MRLRRPVGCALVLLLVVLGTVHAGSPTGPSEPHPEAAPTAAVTSSCAGPPTAAAPTGDVRIDGGDLAPDALAGITVSYGFHLSVVVTRENVSAPVYRGCVHDTANATTNESGAFAFSRVVPPINCTALPGYCAYFTGPFGPTTVRLGATPAGYSVDAAGGPANYTLTLVDDLASVRLSPDARTLTLSPGAATTFGAQGYMANGSLTPLEPTYSWTLSGEGWAFVAPPSGADAEVVAVPGAGVGTLSVAALAVDGEATLAPPPAAVTLLAQSTAIETAELARTTLDAGATIGVRLAGVGAAGYAYSAVFEPGLDLPAAPASCVESPGAGGDTNISCAANLTYPTAGIAQPTARLTNGYSSSVWEFPDVTIDPPPELSVAPGGPRGYAGTALPIVLTVANGTGSPPFATACLRLATEALDCSHAPGPTWTFDVTVSSPGDYSAVAWAIDAQGVNASTAFSVTVVEPLVLGAIAAPSENASVGTAVLLTASLAGGALPVRFWWNASGVDGPILTGTATADGPIVATFVPSAPDAVTVTLTVVDALGTTVEVDRLLLVGPEPALSIVASEPTPATPVTAGTTFWLAWQALDRAGAPVRSFAAGAAIDLSEAGTPVDGWVNASGIGPLASLGGGAYDLPAAGWEGGVADLAVTVTEVGTLTVRLVGAALPAPVPPLSAVIAPDRAHLLLYAPEVAASSARSNSTFWHVTDRYGNPAPGALVTVCLRSGDSSRTTLAAVVAAPGGTTGVWVNFTAAGRGAANVTVTDAAGGILLGPLSVSAVPPGPALTPATVSLGAAIPIGALGAAWSGIIARRARRRSAVPVAEEDLHRLAEGRSQVVEIVRRTGGADLEEIGAAWTSAPPPVELADWLASLVADGTLGAALGADGRARFCLAPGRANELRVTVDAAAFDRALRRRDEMRDEASRDP
ncbi:MAG TPA: hypothetical protein VML94_05635 [Thermoplasmata archaeon]|nr:hypothetical protein [Thermoplasmata archaeon]